MTDSHSLVLRSDADGVATLTLNRPEKRNALNVAMFTALDAHLTAIESDTDRIGAVVIRAVGPIFSAGADLGKQQKPPQRFFQSLTISRLANLPQPVIAAVQGPCLTGGLELILAADIIIASEAARFADTHGKWALAPGWGMTQRLPRRIGTHKAREMMLTGREYDARQAEAMGLVNFFVPNEEFEAELKRLTADVVGLSWHSNRAAKMLLNATQDMTLEAGLAYESYANPGVGPDFSARLGQRFGKA